MSNSEEKILEKEDGLPRQKKDLKILYLNSNFNTIYHYLEYAEILAEKLGLNVTFLKDDNTTLNRIDDDYLGVNWRLGDFDIIIGSFFSDNLINLGPESTKQCKDTGRDLTLLMVYNCSDYRRSVNEIKLKYCYGGRLAPDTEKKFINFYRLCNSFDLPYGEEEGKDWFNSIYSDMLGIISVAVHLYDDALKKNQKPTITDLSEGDIPLKSIDDYICEFEKHSKEQQNIIDKINEIKNIAKKYVSLRKKKLVGELPEDLSIDKVYNSALVIKVYSSGKPIYALNVSPYIEGVNDTRVTFQFFTPEGRKGEKQRLCISSFESPLSQEQKTIIDSISDKLNNFVKPLIDNPEQSDSQGSKPKSIGQYRRYPR